MSNNQKRDFVQDFFTPDPQTITDSSKATKTKRASEKTWEQLDAEREEEKMTNYNNVKYKTKDQKIKENMKKAIAVTPIAPTKHQVETIYTNKDDNKECLQNFDDSLFSGDDESCSQLPPTTEEYEEARQKLNTVISEGCGSYLLVDNSQPNKETELEEVDIEVEEQVDGQVEADVEAEVKEQVEMDQKTEVEEEVSSSCHTPPGLNMSTQEVDDIIHKKIEDGKLNRLCAKAAEEADEILQESKNITKETDVCTFCGLTEKLCPEVLYGKYCVHATLDAYEKVGIHDLSEEDIEDSFKKTYLTLHRHDILKKTNIYDLRSKEQELPKCLVEGSLKYVKEMLKYRKSFVHVYTSRKYDNNNEALSKIDKKDEF